MLLRLFGAHIDPTARVYHSTRIWAPWNLVMQRNSILADDVDCYNVAAVTLEEGAIVSQYAYLCTAGYDVHNRDLPLVTGPIVMRRQSWVGARAVVAKGVTLGEGAVIGLGGVVIKSVPPWTIVGGNPTKEIGRRRVEHDPGCQG
jgi:putative colanic acid biosynthesis acetyltransferase WcaF